MKKIYVVMIVAALGTLVAGLFAAPHAYISGDISKVVQMTAIIPGGTPPEVTISPPYSISLLNFIGSPTLKRGQLSAGEWKFRLYDGTVPHDLVIQIPATCLVYNPTLENRYESTPVIWRGTLTDDNGKPQPTYGEGKLTMRFIPAGTALWINYKVERNYTSGVFSRTYTAVATGSAKPLPSPVPTLTPCTPVP